jgi:hypothetical protein
MIYAWEHFSLLDLFAQHSVFRVGIMSVISASVRMSMWSYYQFRYVCTIGCRFLHAARLDILLSGLCVYILFLWEISRSHAISNFYIQCNNFSKIDNTWWWLYAVETCSEQEGWLDNKLHLRRKYMCTKKSIYPKIPPVYICFHKSLTGFLHA